MSRYRAALYHLGLSLTIFGCVGYVVLYHWYPDYFFAIEGGFEGIRIVLGVDLVLGPLLTLIVFKAGKPGLRLDLSLIGSLQAACLLAGIYIIYSERPLYFVFYEGYFYTAANDVYEERGLQAPVVPEFAGRGPSLVQIKLPENPIEEADLRRVLFQDGIPLWVYGDLYSALDLQEVIDSALETKDVVERDRLDNRSDFLAEHGGEIVDYAFVPIHSRYKQALLAVRRQSLAIVGILDVTPPLQHKPTES